MTENRDDCVIAVLMGDSRLGPFRMPAYDELWIGRNEGNGLHLPESWVSDQQARVIWTEKGWLLQNGDRARMEIKNAYLENAAVAPGGMVVLQPGDTRVAWPQYDDELALSIKVADGIGEGLDALRDAADLRPNRNMTAFVVRGIDLPAADRDALAVVFRHLIVGGPKPANLALAAAGLLGVSEQAVKNRLGKVRDRINRERWNNLTDADGLGEYLVRTTQTLTEDDLKGLPG